jgi:hypothetical protein
VGEGEGGAADAVDVLVVDGTLDGEWDGDTLGDSDLPPTSTRPNNTCTLATTRATAHAHPHPRAPSNTCTLATKRATASRTWT